MYGFLWTGLVSAWLYAIPVRLLGMRGIWRVSRRGSVRLSFTPEPSNEGRERQFVSRGSHGEENRLASFAFLWSEFRRSSSMTRAGVPAAHETRIVVGVSPVLLCQQPTGAHAPNDVRVPSWQASLEITIFVVFLSGVFTCSVCMKSSESEVYVMMNCLVILYVDDVHAWSNGVFQLRLRRSCPSLVVRHLSNHELQLVHPRWELTASRSGLLLFSRKLIYPQYCSGIACV